MDLVRDGKCGTSKSTLLSYIQHVLSHEQRYRDCWVFDGCILWKVKVLKLRIRLKKQYELSSRVTQDANWQKGTIYKNALQIFILYKAYYHRKTKLSKREFFLVIQSRGSYQGTKKLFTQLVLLSLKRINQ